MRRTLLFLIIVIATIQKIKSQTIIQTNLNCNAEFTAAGSPYLIKTDITIATGCYLKINPGVEIRMDENTNIYVNGKIEFLGTASQPIHLHAPTGTWGQIFIDSSSQVNKFNYLIIEDGTHGPDGNSHFSTIRVAAITGYYSDMRFDHCTFKNNKKSIYAKYGNVSISNCTFDSTNNGEKILIQFATGLVENCKLYYTDGLGDAIDFDAVKDGIIRNNYIYGGDADAIDIGQMDGVACDGMLIKKNYIVGMKDKGISCGEGSKDIRIEYNIIAKCNIGVGSKDKSNAIVDHNSMYRNRIGVKCYDHLIGLGGGTMTVTNTIIANSIDSAYRVDPTASLDISYSLSNTDVLPGSNNVFGDPHFMDRNNNDLRLLASSPAINAGDPDFPRDPDGSFTEIGAFYFDPSTTDIADLIILEKINLFPNPCKENLNIEFITRSETSARINVKDQMGRIVYNDLIKLSPFKLNKINTTGFSNGVYFLEVLTEKNRHVAGFMINN